MRVRIDISGHHRYQHVEGEAIAWSTTVTRFDGRDYICPAAIVRTDDGKVHVLALSDGMFQDVRIEVVPEPPVVPIVPNEPQYRPEQPDRTMPIARWKWGRR